MVGTPVRSKIMSARTVFKVFPAVSDFRGAFYRLMSEEIDPLIEKGLCGAIYTQVSDIEEEVNGLLTYDRKVCKLDRN